MRILGIETSCDETALSLIEAEEDLPAARIQVLAEAIFSQIEIHKEFGGVFPALAKRAHSKNLIPLLQKLLAESGFLNVKIKNQSEKLQFKIQNDNKIVRILEREPELLKQFWEFIPTIEKPPIDIIAVTFGPGLEPALWVGINFARALSLLWDIPAIPINHMEGHIVAGILPIKEARKTLTPLLPVKFPALALLISGGHTELVLVKGWLDYEIVGQTRDDAVGEAFDKVARLLGFPYPGGPEISALAEKAKSYKLKAKSFSLPRPMINSPNLDFSFSGLKTAVLYAVKKMGTLSDTNKLELAREFEDAVTDVLVAKTRKAVEQYNARTLIVGGGVIANTEIRRALIGAAKEYPELTLYIPDLALTTDNATMIATAGYIHTKLKSPAVSGQKPFGAVGNLRLSFSAHQ